MCRVTETTSQNYLQRLTRQAKPSRMATYISDWDYHDRRLRRLSENGTMVGFRKWTGEASYRCLEKADLDEIKEMFHMDIIAEQKIMMRDRFNLWIDREAEVKRLQKRYGNRWLDFFVQGTERYETYLHFSLKLDPHARLFNGIKEMPREINRIIMSFLSVPIKFTLIMFTDTTYPFTPMMWDMKYDTWDSLPHGKIISTTSPACHTVFEFVSKQLSSSSSTDFDCLFFDDVVAKCLFYSLMRENFQFFAHNHKNWACGWTPSKMLIVFLMRLKRDLSSLAYI